MKNLRMIGISIIFWFGLGVVWVNAATINNVETGFNSILNNNGIADRDVDDFYGLTVPAEANDTSDASGISSSDLPNTDESIITMELLDSENSALASVATSSPSLFANITKSPPTETVSLDAAGINDEFTDNVSKARNGSIDPELEIYAMLIVCLGLLGLTARGRKDVT